MTYDNRFNLNARVHMPSLFDPDVANDALEVFLDADDRMAGGLAFLFCDDDGRLMQPVLVPDVPQQTTDEERWTAMRWAIGLCEMVCDDHNGPLGLVLAVVHETGVVCDDDRAWHQVALDACAEADVPLIGVHVVTMDGALVLPTTARAA